jgi:2-polyprenyl-3-methyl-5-hydroxy-6-metoxy-1,4-benzoquinol methylase
MSTTLVETESTSCILCSGDQSRMLGEIQMNGHLLGRMVQCRSCGLRFLSPRPTQGQREWLYQQEYETQVSGEDGGTRFQSVQDDQDHARPRFGRYLDQLDPARRSARGTRPRLLDIGAGTGQLLELAGERGWEALALEPSEQACDYMRARLGPGCVVGHDLADCSVGPGSFDAITMAHVIEHRPDPLEALRRAIALLAPGGRLLVATPNDASLYERLWQTRHRWAGNGMANPHVMLSWRNGTWLRTPAHDNDRALVEFQILTTEHLYFFTRSTLERLLRRASFTNVRWSAGSVQPARTAIGRALRNDIVNPALLPLRLQSELVAVAEKRMTTA